MTQKEKKANMKKVVALARIGYFGIDCVKYYNDINLAMAECEMKNIKEHPATNGFIAKWHLMNIMQS